jgi:two-component system, LytTR family, response regulator
MSHELLYAIIEDDRKVCQSIKAKIDAFPGWRLSGLAHHIEDAITLVSQEKPNLIFLDWDLKGGSAFEVLQHIQNTQDYDPFVIFNTGYQSENPEIPQEVINNYAVDKYLVKPIFEQLRQNLPKYLEEAKAKASKNDAVSSAIWMENILGTKVKINIQDIICICQNPAEPRSRIIFCDKLPKETIVSLTWEKCCDLLNEHRVDYFIPKSRESIIMKHYIEQFEKPYVRLRNIPFKIEVTKEKVKEFEAWLKK